MKDVFYSLFPEIQSPPPLSQGGREEGEFTKKSQEKKGEKVGGETAEMDERKSLPACVLSKLIPPSAKSNYLIFYLPKKLVS